MAKLNLFGKKADAGDSADKSGSGEKKAAPVKKKVNILKDSLQISVPATILDVIRKNANFTEGSGSKAEFYGAVLYAENLEGFESKNNPVAGQLFESVRGGKIDMMITDETNDKGMLVFVPNTNTLASLEDYSLFTKAIYELVVISKSLAFEKTGIKLNYAQLREIAHGKKKLGEVLKKKPQEAEAATSASTAAEAATVHASEEALNKAAQTEKPVPVQSRSASKAAPAPQAPAAAGNSMQTASQSAKPSQALVNPASDVFDNFDDFGSDFPEDVPFDDLPDASYQNEGSYPEDEVDEEITDIISPEDVSDAIQRSFYSENLELVVSTEPFLQRFVYNMPLQMFDVNDDRGFVDDVMHQMKMSYNDTMTRFHQENVSVLQAKYLDLMTLRVNRIQEMLDLENPDTKYGEQKSMVVKARNNYNNMIDSTVKRRQEEKEQSYQDARNAFADAAKAMAASNYDAQHRKQHDIEMSQIEGDVRDEIQAEYNRALNEIHQNRQVEGQHLMDLNVTEALNEIAADWQSMLEAEAALYREYQQSLQDYREGLRRDDANRTLLLQEQLAQRNEANEVREAMTLEMQSLTQQFSSEMTAVKEESARIKRQSEESMALVRQHADEHVNALTKEKDSLSTQLSELTERYENIDEKNRKDYERRIEQYKDEKEAWRLKCEADAQLNKHQNKLGVFLSVAACLVFCALGVVGGMSIQTKIAEKTTYEDIISRFEPATEVHVQEADETPKLIKGADSYQEHPEKLDSDAEDNKDEENAEEKNDDNAAGNSSVNE